MQSEDTYDVLVLERAIVVEKDCLYDPMSVFAQGMFSGGTYAEAACHFLVQMGISRN